MALERAPSSGLSQFQLVRSQRGEDDASSARPSSAPSQSSIYNSLALQIPSIPDFVARSCATLSGGSLSHSKRATRAWEAGWWARFCLEGRISKPRPTVPFAVHCAQSPGLQLPSPSSASRRLSPHCPGLHRSYDLERVRSGGPKEDALVGLEPFNAQVHTSDLVTGYVEDLAVVPEFSSVLAFTRQWVNVMDAQRISFYSADEGGTTPTAKLKAKAKTKGGVVPKPPKPMSAKKVAEAIGSMAEMMPMLQAQLVTMQEEQKRMQEALNLQSVQAAMRPGQTPVSSSLQDFMALTGPPPKTKGVTLKPPPQRVPKAVSKDTDLSLAQQSEQAWHWQC